VNHSVSDLRAINLSLKQFIFKTKLQHKV